MAKIARSLTDDEREMVLDRMANGETMKSIADLLNCTPRQLHYCLEKDPLLRKSADEARSLGNEMLCESILTIADIYDNPHKARVKIDAIKWVLSIYNRARFGDKVDVRVTQEYSLQEAMQDAQSRIMPLLVERAQARDVTPVNENDTINDLL